MSDATGIRLIHDDYLALTRRKRLYSGILLAIFVALMTSGFMLADSRNAGGFWSGLHRVLDFPKTVVAEAADKAAELPGHIVTYFPALVETLNIAAVSTLTGALGGTVLSMLATRGMARWPARCRCSRRGTDSARWRSPPPRCSAAGAQKSSLARAPVMSVTPRQH